MEGASLRACAVQVSPSYDRIENVYTRNPSLVASNLPTCMQPSYMILSMLLASAAACSLLAVVYMQAACICCLHYTYSVNVALDNQLKVLTAGELHWNAECLNASFRIKELNSSNVNHVC